MHKERFWKRKASSIPDIEAKDHLESRKKARSKKHLKYRRGPPLSPLDPCQKIVEVEDDR
ncbi:MAG: hypothetical protein PVH85_07290 [Desulfobacterales bacterium]